MIKLEMHIWQFGDSRWGIRFVRPNQKSRGIGQPDLKIDRTYSVQVEAVRCGERWLNDIEFRGTVKVFMNGEPWEIWHSSLEAMRRDEVEESA